MLEYFSECCEVYVSYQFIAGSLNLDIFRRISMIYNNIQTIAAISTAVTDSGIGIVRMSGEQSIEIADKVYRGKNKKKLCNQKAYTIHYGYIVDGDNVIDEVLVMLMKSPHSYTGEDTVEINCHGGTYVVKKILDTLIKYGARPAEPGEFTKRAFLNGRMDLSQAEAVIDVIQSKNEYALQSSISQLNGSIKKVITEIREKLLYHTAYIESALDDPEHINIDGYGNILKPVVDAIMIDIQKLIHSFTNGRIIKEGINTVILGKPNAGKSSLLNMLIGQERAIVTDIAGTTRDILQEHIQFGGIHLNIIDTAGIRETKDIIEQIGVDKALNCASDSDLILFVIDSSMILDENDKKIFEYINNKNVVILLNKSDLMQITRIEDIKEMFLLTNPSISNFQIPVLEISAKSGCGIDLLEDTLKKIYYDGEISFNSEIYITNIRHREALKNAYDSLNKVIESILSDMPEDFLSIDLIDAYEALGSITGETIGEDLINEIFSKFCMGK